jgi:hypothetical protein
MEHNAHAQTVKTVNPDTGAAYSRTFAYCPACEWTFPGGQASDRMAHAHNATENTNGVDNDRWLV